MRFQPSVVEVRQSRPRAMVPRACHRARKGRKEAYRSDPIGVLSVRWLGRLGTAALSEDSRVAKFIVKATNRGWEIHKDDVLLSVHDSRRAALASLRAELKARGERSLIKFQAQPVRPRSN